MTLPNPDLLFDRLAPYLPEVPAWVWRMVAGIGLLASAGVVALHRPWVGGVLLLAGALAAAAGEAVARRHGKPALPVLPLGLLAIPFGFALAEPIAGGDVPDVRPDDPDSAGTRPCFCCHLACHDGFPDRLYLPKSL
jgi:hypothetical protein